MRFTSFITLGALSVATMVSGLQDINNRDLDAIDSIHPLARDLSAENIPIEARAPAVKAKTTARTTATTTARATATTTSAASTSSTAAAVSCPMKRSRILGRNLFDATKGKANGDDGCDWALQENEYKLGNKLSSDDSVCVINISGCSAVTISVAGKKTSTFHILAGMESDGKTAAQLVKDNVGTATGAVIDAASDDKFKTIKDGIQSVFPGLTVKQDANYPAITGNNRYKFAVNLDTGAMTRSEYTSTCKAQA